VPPGPTLLIVESPKKARTIGAILGSGYQVEASFGHVRDLPQRELGVDVASGFQPKYVPVPKARQRLARLRTAVGAAGRVLLATDPDREGEAIAWHLAVALGLRSGAFGRVAFHEITGRAIRDALAHPRGLDQALVDAQQARRVLDRLVGYQVSPLLWHKVRRGTSAGRVQSVALRLVVEREREIAAFVPEEYWTVAVSLAPPERPVDAFRAGLVELDGRKPELRDQAAAEAVVAWLRDEATRYAVAGVERKTREKVPPPPFTTSTLQQAAAGRLRLGAKRTMALAQSLYEAGAITYHRTDSVHSAPEAVEVARKVIEARFGPEHLPERPRFYATRQKNAQEAHEAIRPTDPARLAADLKASVAADERRLYQLIWQRFLASQMAAARYLVDTAQVEAVHPSHRARLEARATLLAFPGYLAVYGVEEGEEEDDESPHPQPLSREAGEGGGCPGPADGTPLPQTGPQILSGGGGAEREDPTPTSKRLPALQAGEGLVCLGVDAAQHFTKPPPRYTEASLVKALEALGVGRPSTYATILATIEERGYATLTAAGGDRRRAFVPTDLGMAANDFLCRHFATVVDPAFTAGMEEGLDDVARGEVGWRDLLARFYGPFSEALAAARAAEKVAVPAGAASAPKSRPRSKGRRAAPEPTGESCPRCGKPLVRRVSAYGPFVGCSGFPECRYTSPLPGPGPREMGGR